MTAVAAPRRPGDGQRGRGRAAGGHNAGQKLLFWTLLLCMLVLLVTGVVIWRAYFSHYFGIDVIRCGPAACAGGVRADPQHHRAHLRRDLDQGLDRRHAAWLGQPRLGTQAP
jgi:hypothetical protein